MNAKLATLRLVQQTGSWIKTRNGWQLSSKYLRFSANDTSSASSIVFALKDTVNTPMRYAYN